MENYEQHLLLVLKYDSYKRKMLTGFDRMFIHQNIAAYLNGRDYNLCATTKEKVLTIIENINKENWESPY